MRLHILSDLHLEFGPYEPAVLDADVMVLAGDTHVGARGVDWAMRRFSDRLVVYVAGNHEFYGQTYPLLLDKLRERTAGSNVCVLENYSFVHRGVRFLGCTLWTDFRLHADLAGAIMECHSSMSDFHKIRVSPSFRRFRPSDAIACHLASVKWLKDELAVDRGLPTVVVTHHAPSPRSLPENLRQDPVSAAYASNLEKLVASSAAGLWIHGHVHEACDYMIGGTRVLANPRGYPGEPATGFNPGLVIEI